MGLTVATPAAGQKVKGAWTADVAGRINEMQDPFSFRFSNSTTSLTSGVDGRITWTTLVSSSGVTVSSNNRITFNKAGRWQFRLGIRYAAGGTANREHMAAVRRFNSSNVIQEIMAQGGGASDTGVYTALAAGDMIVAATDYCEAWGFQGSGIAKAPDNGPTVGFGWTHFSARWVGTS
jgi:hypothetical protein